MNNYADLILLNAHIITLNPNAPGATAMAMTGPTIERVGAREDMQDLRGHRTKVIDCQGGVIVPGFNDAHCHPLAVAANELGVDCSPAHVRSIADIQERLATRAKQVAKGTWIKCNGYNEFYLAEQRHPTRQDLDSAAPDHPVKLTHRSGHACVLNSLAMLILDVHGTMTEPPGAIIDRDLESGEPNGLLIEMNDWVDDRIPPYAAEDLDFGMQLANEVFVSQGVTSVQDAGWNRSVHRCQLYTRLQEARRFLPHVSVMFGLDEMQTWLDRGLSSGSKFSDRVRLGGVKFLISSAKGEVIPEQEDLNNRVCQAFNSGYQVCLHAVERNEISAAVFAVEYALAHVDRLHHRHRIEHCAVCPPTLAKRIKDRELLVVTQPSFVYYSGERYFATVPREDLNWLYPIGQLMRSKIMVAAGSDTPVVPPNPLVSICATVTRKSETGQALLPDQAMPFKAALEMHTTAGAYASFEEHTKGRLVPGMQADAVLLDKDPAKIPPDEIKDIKVLKTIIGGRIAWEA